MNPMMTGGDVAQLVLGLVTVIANAVAAGLNRTEVARLAKAHLDDWNAEAADVNAAARGTGTPPAG